MQRQERTVLSGLILTGVLLLAGIGWLVFARPIVPPVTRLSVSATQTTPGRQEASSTPLEAPVPAPVIEEPSEEATDARLLVVGDIMLDRTVLTRTKKSGDPAYPFRALPAGWLSGFDLTVGNLEGPLTPTRRPPEKSIDFQFDPTWASVLRDQGFDMFSQANNHALDQGAVGYSDSVARLREAGFLVFGHQVDDGLVSLATTTVNGQRIAFVGWNTTDNPINFSQAEQALTVARSQTDTVIAFLHWGQEYRDHPESQTVTLAHWLIDHGVDVVVGGHPHWVQGISSYKGKPIVWSLGNFVFDQDWSKETQQGLAIGLQISPKEVKIQPYPVSVKASQPALEEGEILKQRLSSLAKISDPELRDLIQSGTELVFSRGEPPGAGI